VKFTFTGVPKPETVQDATPVAAVAATEPAPGPSSASGSGGPSSEGPGTAQAIG